MENSYKEESFRTLDKIASLGFERRRQDFLAQRETFFETFGSPGKSGSLGNAK